MADQPPYAATPPAPSGGLTIEQVNEAVAKALGPVADVLKGLSEGHKTLSESVAKLTTPATGAAGGAGGTDVGKAKPLTAEDVSKIVQDSLKGFQAGQAKSQARTAYATSRMADLPATYRNLLPETDDAAALAQAEQAIRDQFKAELGDKLKVPATVASGGGGAAASGQIDFTKLSSTQLIEHGIKSGAAAANGTIAAGAAEAAAKVQAAAAAAGAAGAGTGGGGAAK